ncbi:MAG: CoA transferase [Chloroflexi bacterium]|nr:CoA transferase [Chloroflexota bacterium]
MSRVLEGVRVLDFTTAIAGSYAIRLLADLGADVIKVESFEGDSFRSQVGNFVVWNSGKRGIVVDLRRKEGREIIYRLVRNVDVIAQNFRPGTARKLGIDYETLSAINPRLVYSSASSWGDTGPYGGKPGYDPVLQAESGIMASQGRGQATPMDLTHAEVDIATTALHAYSILAALYAREATGQGQHVKTSLMAGALAVQADTFVFCQGKPASPSAGDGYLGPAATNRFYKTRDGWTFIECEDDRSWEALCQALVELRLKDDERFSSPALRGQNDGALAAILTQAFSTRSSAEALEQLQGAGVPSAPVNGYDRIPQEPQVVACALLGDYYQPVARGYLKQQGTFFKLAETPSSISRPAPLLGEHTREVLSELRYSPDEIDHLRELRVIP